MAKKKEPYVYLFLALAVLVLIVVVVSIYLKTPAYSGGNGQQQTVEEQQQIVEASKVQSLSTILPRAKNADLDPEKDVVEVTLSPKDADGNLVHTTGLVNVRLWDAAYDENYNRIRGRLLQEWNNVPVSKDGYDFYGNKIALQLNFVPEKNSYGFLEVMLTTLDGRSFAAKDSLIVLGLLG